ncbi:2723_t:CDS:1 [Paraglomus occultum]|uniref:2723_t:CDS:1 n=1 Tax=Paraglomus occultum TaxID=144539 RepID=A0A9N9BX60_9GLOM|nr:2723_t:CDS:1 [Paraglomus occultum]
MESLLSHFETSAQSTVNNAQRALEEIADINTLEMHIECLDQLVQIYRHLMIAPHVHLRLETIENLRSALKQKVNRLNSSSTSSRNRLIQYESTGGRRRVVIPVLITRNLREEGLSWSNIANLFGISDRTLRRRRNELNIPDDFTYSNVTDAELDNIVRQIKGENPFAGQILVMGGLRSRGLRVHRQRVRESLHRVDPFGTAMRLQNLIPRRRYSVAGPNALWHIDGNHKLIKWKFVIHGGIDGYSRCVVYLKCNPNNRATTVLNCFREACATWGVPSRTRSDHGMENIQVADFMINYRGTDRGSHLCGTSVHNQRIERLWGDLNRTLIKFFRLIFIHLEEEYNFDIDDVIQLYCLHYVYMERINRALNMFTENWNNHSIRTEHNRTPLQLRQIGMTANHYLAYEEYNNIDDNYGVEEIHDNNEQGDNEDGNVTDETFRNLLTRNEYDVLRNRFNPIDDDENSGINIFLETVAFVRQLLQSRSIEHQP